MFSTTTMASSTSMPIAKISANSETRLMVKQAKDWKAYTYAWNAEQTDAELVGADGAELALENGETWRVPSRVDCMNCHSRAANFLLNQDEGGAAWINFNKPAASAGGGEGARGRRAGGRRRRA